jgi:hypothetical protein
VSGGVILLGGIVGVATGMRLDSNGDNDDNRSTAAVGFLFSHVLPAVMA